mgnify:CR=1 FL=1
MRVLVFSIECYEWSLSLSLMFFFQAEDGIRDLVRSRGLGDVYKRQVMDCLFDCSHPGGNLHKCLACCYSLHCDRLHIDRLWWHEHH